MNNPLIPDVLSILRQQANGISEFELMQQLAEHEFFCELPDEGQLALFQKHFMIMNALYELQHQFWQDEKVFLDVSPLKIYMTFSSDKAAGRELVMSENNKLSEYYRDWKNFENTDEADVNNLLNNFWQCFTSQDKREEACEVLEIEVDAEEELIVTSYRRLAAKHHPDKGGDKEMFIRIRQAYEILKITS